MLKPIYWIGIGLLVVFSCTDNGETDEKLIPRANNIIVQYPETYQDSSEVTFYGETKVVDAYRWLEYEYSPSVNHWVKSQQSLTRKYFDSLPEKWLIEQRLKDLWSYERFSLPEKKGNYYYVFINKGLQNQSVFYRSQSIEGPFEEVFDPNTLAKDGTISIDAYHFSETRDQMAIQLSSKGSDWKTIRVLDLKTGKLLADEIKEVKFSKVAWDANGFFYSRFPSAQHYDRSIKNEFHQLYYHRIGTPQEQDEMVFADRIFPHRNAEAIATIDERFLLLNLKTDARNNALYFRNLADVYGDFTPIYPYFDHPFDFVGSYGNKLLYKTTHGAKKGRLIEISANRPSMDNWITLIPEQPAVLADVHLLGNKLVAHFLDRAKSSIKVFSLDGAHLYDLDLKPLGLGAVTQITGNPENNEAFFGFSSFNFPESIYRLNLNNGAIEPYFVPKIDFDRADYEVQQIAYKSYDGVEIPMFIIHRKGLRLTGDNPCLLMAIGGMGEQAIPKFNSSGIQLMPIILEHDGVCAVANLRGNQELGEDWLKAGILQKKQNSFDDFQAAAEYLIANKYTSSKKLAIYGRANGGLIVGASITQRPDLFRVAVPSTGLFDMLRYHDFSAAWLWAGEYGESTNSEMFNFLYAYSPLHHVIGANYPATLIMAADHEDRILPAHAYKYTAALQAKQRSFAPILIQIEEGAGHDQGKPLSQVISEGANVLNFILFNLDEAVVY
ncbi:MAG: prolyl oligopeptidase family serine peptidase [Saprospiraceae bacterium]